MQLTTFGQVWNTPTVMHREVQQNLYFGGGAN